MESNKNYPFHQIEQVGNNLIIINPSNLFDLKKLFGNKDAIPASHKIHIFYSRATESFDLVDCPQWIRGIVYGKIPAIANFACTCARKGMIHPVYVHYPRNARWIHHFFQERYGHLFKELISQGKIKLIREDERLPIPFKLSERPAYSMDKDTYPNLDIYKVSTFRIIRWDGDSIRKSTQEFGYAYDARKAEGPANHALRCRIHDYPNSGGIIYDNCYY